MDSGDWVAKSEALKRFREKANETKDRLREDPEMATRWMGDARAAYWFTPTLFIFSSLVGDQAGGGGMNTMWLSFYVFPMLYWSAIVTTARRYQKEGVGFFPALFDAAVIMMPVGLHIVLKLFGWVGHYETSTDLAFFYIADLISAIGCIVFLKFAVFALFPKKEAAAETPVVAQPAPAEDEPPT